jgi:hypothetical protein
MCRKKTKEEFEINARKIHGNDYEYDKVIYQGSHIKIDIFCKRCHKYFSQTPNSHLKGSGCRGCHIKSTIKTMEEFLEDAKIIHPDEEYEYDRVIYKSARKKLRFFVKDVINIFGKRQMLI